MIILVRVKYIVYTHRTGGRLLMMLILNPDY